MKRSLFYTIIIISFWQIKSHSQVNYFEYHKKIIAAEELFLNNDLNGAIRKYKLIFKEYKPFAKDCFIALQLACLKRDTTSLTYLFEKSFENGVSWRALMLSANIRAILAKYPSYSKVILNMYKTIRPEYISRLNFFLRAQCLAMQKKDGVYHELPYYWANRNTKDSLYSKILEENINDFVKIVRVNGFPGEKTIGVWDIELDHFCEENRMLRFEPFITMFFYHHGCGYVYLKNELLEAVKKGELHPRTYALIYEWAYEDLKDNARNPSKANLSRFYRHNCSLPKRDKYYNLFIDHRLDYKDTAFVNRCRASLNISSLEHDKKKKDYAEKHNIHLFFGLFEGEACLL